MNRDHMWFRKPLIIDAGIAVGVAAALMLLAGIATEEGATPPDVVAYGLAALVGLTLIWRRRFPIGVALASLLPLFAYHVLGYPALGNLPLAFALLNASYYSAAVAASGIAALAFAGSLGWFLLGEGLALAEAFNIMVREMGILAAMILAGSVLHSRRLLAEETQQRVRLARADEEAKGDRRRMEDRMAIAREIHDVVSHTVALIGIQARAAADSFEEAPQETAKALRAISDSTREATAELQATISVLRGARHSTVPAPTLNDLKALVDSVSTGDLEVSLNVSGERRDLSGLVELVGYRVVQEALTNVVKHARASMAHVDLEFGHSQLTVEVSDDGVGRPGTEGHGIGGMRERVEAVGGALSVGPSPDGGVLVSARIPTGVRA